MASYLTLTMVYVKTTFVGFHRWKDAPAELEYLRSYHRHVFHVKLGVVVTHSNREVEFHTLQKDLANYIDLHYDDEYFDASCEMIAADLINHFDAVYANVSEDDENGAVMMRKTVL